MTKQHSNTMEPNQAHSEPVLETQQTSGQSKSRLETLPDELLIKICTAFNPSDHVAAKLNLCLTSKKLLKIAQPFLFEEVLLWGEQTSAQCSPNIVKLLKIFDQKPHLAMLVKQLHVSNFRLYLSREDVMVIVYQAIDLGLRSHAAVIQESDIDMPASEAPTPRYELTLEELLVELLLLRMNNLRHLRMHPDMEPVQNFFSHPSITDVALDNALPYLDSIDISGSHWSFDEQQFNITKLANILRKGSLQRLEICADFVFARVRRAMKSVEPLLTNISYVEIECQYIADRDLSNVISACPNLTKFKLIVFEDGRGPIEERELGVKRPIVTPRTVGDALQVVRSTLKYLELRIAEFYRLEPWQSRYPFDSIKDLCSLTALEELVVGQSDIVGEYATIEKTHSSEGSSLEDNTHSSDGNDMHSHDHDVHSDDSERSSNKTGCNCTQLALKLPRSLKHLAITGAHPSILGELVSLARVAPTGFPNLKSVEIRTLDSWWYSDYSEFNRSTFDIDIDGDIVSQIESIFESKDSEESEESADNEDSGGND